MLEKDIFSLSHLYIDVHANIFITLKSVKGKNELKVHSVFCNW